MLPFESYVGVVRLPIEVIWFCWLCVRFCPVPSVVSVDQFPKPSKLRFCVRLDVVTVSGTPSLLASLKAPRRKSVIWLKLSYAPEAPFAW